MATPGNPAPRTSDQSGPVPPGALVRTPGQRDPRLAGTDLKTLLVELQTRLAAGETPTESAELIALGDAVCERLSSSLQVHENRFSPRRFHDLFWVFYRQLAEPRPPIAGATWLDLGCGSVNPLGMVFLMFLLGAKRGIAVDLDPVQDLERAARGLARLAAAMLEDPAYIPCEFAVTRAQLAANLGDLDLARLQRGDTSGLQERFLYRNESASRLSLESGSIDVVMSNSFLEHIEQLDEVLAEIARVTARSGFGVHSIDGIDHHHYGNRALHPLDFLRRPQPGMVHGSNRVRPLEFPAWFERHGMKVQQMIRLHTVPVTPEVIDSFAMPWRAMSREALETTTVVLVVRKS
jgi:SAM-dependent methyltransferase